MRHLVKEIYAAVKALHSQVFVALFTVILILAIPQIQELIKMFAEDGWGVSTAHTFLALIGLYLLTWSIWVSGRWLTVRLIEVDHEAENEALRSLTPFEVWLPRVLGVLPQVAILILIVKLLFFDRSIEPVLHRIILWFYAIFITATSVAFIHYTKKRKQNSAQRTSHEDALVTRGRGAFNIPMWGYGAVVGFVTVLALTLSTNAAFTRYFGTLFLAFAFLSFLVLLLTLLNWHSKKHGVPYILLLALIAVYVAWSDISDNHRLTLAPKVVEKPSSSDAFESWYKNLAERYDSTTNQDAIPVYLVAAQGGGIFAAYHSAMFLAAVEDDCPGFSDHLFAISSVSGGSLGSALFVDVLRERKVNPRKQKPVLNDVQFTKPNKFKDLPTCSPVAASLGEEELSSSQSQLLTADLKRAFQDDWLSPIVARTLFSEPVLTFLPLPCSSADEGGFLHKFCARFDQAKTLEASLRRSARRGRSDRETHLIESFSSYYSTELHLPNLLINTADSTSGRRVVMSPMTFKAAGMSNMDLYLADTKDISVSEAAVLSARFPFFTQAGYVVEEESAIHLCKGRGVRL